MQREVTGISHEPFGRGGANTAGVTIEFDDGTELVIRKSRGLTNFDAHEISAGMLRTYNSDVDYVESILDDVSDDIPGEVERTCRRVLKLQSWLSKQDLDIDCRVKTHGYNRLRNQRLVLVTSTTSFDTSHRPVVIGFREGSSDEFVERRCDEIVEKRIVDSMNAMQRAHYLQPETYYDDEENHPGKINADEVIEVESLAEANAIVYGDDGQDDERSEPVNVRADRAGCEGP